MKSKAQFYGKPGVYRIFNQVPNRFEHAFGVFHRVAFDKFYVDARQPWIDITAPDGTTVEKALLKSGETRSFAPGQVARMVLGLSSRELK